MFIMFCPKCGADNSPEAAFCRNCGNQLQTQGYNSPGAATNPYPSRTFTTVKSPIVAAVLNLFWGLGYWYLGYRRVLGIPTLYFIIGAVIVYFLFGYFTVGILSLIIAIILAIDGYQKGQGQRGFISAEM